MRLLIRYATAGIVVFVAGLMISYPTGREPGALTDPAPPILIASRSPPARPAPAADVAPKDERSISAALAVHGNPHDIQPSFFVDLVRSMEKNGFARDAAYAVVIALAQNPKLDTIAGLTVAGSVQGYMAEAGEPLDAALTELAKYIEQPAANAGEVGERFGILEPETEALIGGKVRSGNDVAAQRLMEEALLRRFNPSLAAKIFVPRSGSAMCCEALSPAASRDLVARSEPPPMEQRRRSAGRYRVLSSSPRRYAHRWPRGQHSTSGETAVGIATLQRLKAVSSNLASGGLAERRPTLSTDP